MDEGYREAARDRWDPAYLAAQLGPDPAAHLDWVRTWTAWVPYRGALRGPAGVLLDRQGNSLDRALLLADLLKRAGHEVRLARGELDDARARTLLPSLLRARAVLGQRSAPEPATDWRDDLRLAAAGYRQDSARVLHAVEGGLDSASRLLDTLDARTAEQSGRLGALLPKPKAGSDGEEDPVAALRDHWWVQRLEEGRWTDLDPLGVTHGPDDPVPATFDPAALDSSLYQRVVVRLVTERVSGGALIEQRGLELELRPSELAGKPVVLQILPAGLQPGLIVAVRDPAAGFRTSAIEEQEWRASLVAGGAVAEAVISAARGASGTTGNPFGGLGLGIGKVADQGRDELSAAWVEYETRIPGSPPRIDRRQLFDLVGPAARASKAPVRLDLSEDRRLERSLALTRVTEILLLGSAVAPEYLLHLTAKSALANRNFLRGMEPPRVDAPDEDMEAFAKAVAPVPSDLYTLAVARMSADPDADVYLARPNILSRHVLLASRRGRIVRLEGTDIVTNDVAAAPLAADPVAVRRRQGVRDTNLEALLYGGGRVLGSVAEEFARSPRWAAVTAPDDLPAGLPADVRQRMRDDLAAGYALVVPASVPPETPAEAVTWWRSDPRTGATLGVSGTGWGSTLTERILKHSVLLGTMVVEAWTFEFLRCIGGIGEPPSGGPVARAESPLDWLATPAWAEEGESRKSVCVWEAWRAALLAGMFYKASVVWGILAKQIKLWRMMRALPPGEAVIPGGSPAGGAPAGGKPGGAPPAKPPPEECPPGGGGTGGSGEPAAAPPPGEAPAGPPRPPEEPAVEPVQPSEPAEPAPKPAEEPLPETPSRFNEVTGDIPPMPAGHYEAQANAWAAREPGAAQVLQQEEAFAREADAVAERARQELAAMEKSSPPPGNDEPFFKRMGYLRSLIQRAEQAPQAVARARAALERIRALVETSRRLESLNQALIQARTEAREASEIMARMVRNGQADFESNQYAQWRKVMERYEKALAEYAAANRELGKIPRAPQTPGVTLPAANDPVRGGGPQGQCSNAGQPANSPPAGSPPPGSPPPGSPEANSPPLGSPPPSPAADAQRRLAEAEQALGAAKNERDQALREMDEATEKMFADEAAAQARGEGIPPQTNEYRAALRRKMDAIQRVWRLEEQYNLARFQVQQLAQQAAAAGGGGVLVGLGGMGGP